jgi:hypothetical protein
MMEPNPLMVPELSVAAVGAIVGLVPPAPPPQALSKPAVAKSNTNN